MLGRATCASGRTWYSRVLQGTRGYSRVLTVARQGDVRKRQNALYKTKEAFDDETLFVLLKQYAPGKYSKSTHGYARVV